jgi:hypothetical protein
MLPLGPDTIIAMASAIIALAAFVVAVWQGYLTRKHDRLSVTPHLRIDTSVGAAPICVTISNRGVGPAIIKSISISVDRQRFQGDEFDQIIAALRRLELANIKFTARLPHPPELLAAGEVLDMLVFHESDASTLDRLNEVLPHLAFHIAYENIYQEPFTLSSSPVEWQRGALGRSGAPTSSGS